MTEKNDQYDDNGYIDATFDGKEIKGTWIDKDKTKTLSFVATRK
jgi:hypothetical protein